MKSAAIPAPLLRLYERVEACERCCRENNTLRHVLGGGKFTRPTFFFLFINPTHKNLSSRPDYRGVRRFPFIGVRHLYRGLAEAGFLDAGIVRDLYEYGWQTGDEHRVEESLRRHSVYISNFVKCARPNPVNPTRTVMKEDLPLLAQELSLVRPKYIVTFGALPLSVLTGKDYRMRDILASLDDGTYAPIVSPELGGRRYPILPCFYPLGHGNPPKAHRILTHIKHRFG